MYIIAEFSLLFFIMTRYTVCGVCDETCKECLETGTNCHLCYVHKDEISALECNTRGDLICGQCKCHPGYSGIRCEINHATNRSTEELCRKGSSSAICSGRGDCVVGRCECHTRRANSAQRFSGRYCECDDYSCNYFNGRLCGGRGVCNCGVCDCNQGYTGNACNCVESNATCISRDGRICYGYGYCVCGQCKCHKDSRRTGPTCNHFKYGHEVCRRAWPCMQCMVLHQGQYDKELCRRECKQYEDTVDLVDVVHPDGLHTCEFISDDDCSYTFGYSYDETDQVIFKFQTTAECPSWGSSSSTTVYVNSSNLSDTLPLMLSLVCILIITVFYLSDQNF